MQDFDVSRCLENQYGRIRLLASFGDHNKKGKVEMVRFRSKRILKTDFN